MNFCTVHFPLGNVQMLGSGGGSATQRSLVSLRHSQVGARRSFLRPARWAVTAVVLDRGEQLPDAAAEVAAELKVAGGAGGGGDVARPLVVAPSTGSGREGDLQDRRGRQAAVNRHDLLGTLHCQALVWRHPGSLMHADLC